MRLGAMRSPESRSALEVALGEFSLRSTRIISPPSLRTLEFTCPHTEPVVTRGLFVARELAAKCDCHSVGDHLLVQIACPNAAGCQQSIETILPSDRASNIMVADQTRKMTRSVAAAWPLRPISPAHLRHLGRINTNEPDPIASNHQGVAISDIRRSEDFVGAIGAVLAH